MKLENPSRALDLIILSAAAYQSGDKREARDKFEEAMAQDDVAESIEILNSLNDESIDIEENSTLKGYEPVYERQGYNWSHITENEDGLDHHFEHPDGHKLQINEEGSWVHSSGGEGHSPKSLNRHLSTLHGTALTNTETSFDEEFDLEDNESLDHLNNSDDEQYQELLSELENSEMLETSVTTPLMTLAQHQKALAHHTMKYKEHKNEEKKYEALAMNVRKNAKEGDSSYKRVQEYRGLANFHNKLGKVHEDATTAHKDLIKTMTKPKTVRSSEEFDLEDMETPDFLSSSDDIEMLETSVTVPNMTLAQHQKAIEQHAKGYAHHMAETKKYDALTKSTEKKIIPLEGAFPKEAEKLYRQEQEYRGLKNTHYDLASAHKEAILFHKNSIKTFPKPKVRSSTNEEFDLEDDEQYPELLSELENSEMLETSVTTPLMTLAQHQKAIEQHAKGYAHHKEETKKYDALSKSALKKSNLLGEQHTSKEGERLYRRAQEYGNLANSHNDLASAHKFALLFHKESIKTFPKPKVRSSTNEEFLKGSEDLDYLNSSEESEIFETSGRTAPLMTLDEHQKAIELHTKMLAHHKNEEKKYRAFAHSPLSITDDEDRAFERSQEHKNLANRHYGLGAAHEDAIHFHKQLIKTITKPKVRSSINEEF